MATLGGEPRRLPHPRPKRNDRQENTAELAVGGRTPNSAKDKGSEQRGIWRLTTQEIWKNTLYKETRGCILTGGAFCFLPLNSSELSKIQKRWPNPEDSDTPASHGGWGVRRARAFGGLAVGGLSQYQLGMLAAGRSEGEKQRGFPEEKPPQSPTSYNVSPNNEAPQLCPWSGVWMGEDEEKLQLVKGKRRFPPIRY